MGTLAFTVYKNLAGRNVQIDHEIVVGVLESVPIGSSEFEPEKDRPTF